MDLSNIKDMKVRQHVQRILSFEEEERCSIWESQYNNIFQDYKHPLADKIQKALSSLNINICTRKFSLPKGGYYDHYESSS